MADTQTVTLGRRSLHQLRAALERSLGVQAAPLLQEAGFVERESLRDLSGIPRVAAGRAM